MTRHLLLAAMAAYCAWRWCVVPLLHASDVLRAAPWPHPSRYTRATPEPPRLRVVRGARVYDWQNEEAS